DAVSGGPDAIDLGVQAVVDDDPARGSDRYSGRRGQRRVGPYSQADDRQIGGDLSGGGIDRGEASALVDEAGDAGAEQDLHAQLLERGGDQARHVGVEGQHRLVGQLDQRHLEAPRGERLGDLDADVAAADHDRTPRPGVDGGTHRVGAGDGPQVEHAWPVDAGQRRLDGGGAGGDEELSVRFDGGPASVERADLDGAGRRVDGRDLVAGADVDAP